MKDEKVTIEITITKEQYEKIVAMAELNDVSIHDSARFLMLYGMNEISRDSVY